jgi:adenylate cyclase
LIRLTYVSTALKNFPKQELDDIAINAQNNNKKNNITGYLIMSYPYFFQTIEGDEDAINNLYYKIRGDKRHCNCIILDKTTIFKREYSEWNMNVKNADEIMDLALKILIKNLARTILSTNAYLPRKIILHKNFTKTKSFILCTDIVNYTTICEKFNLDTTTQLVNVFTDICSKHIAENKGDVIKLVGDCVIASFDNHENILSCAIDILYEIRQLRNNSKENSIFSLLNNGIGISYGDNYCGIYGDNKKDYSVFGKNINDATMAESKTREYEYEIIITQDVAKILKQYNYNNHDFYNFDSSYCTMKHINKLPYCYIKNKIANLNVNDLYVETIKMNYILYYNYGVDTYCFNSNELAINFAKKHKLKNPYVIDLFDNNCITKKKEDFMPKKKSINIDLKELIIISKEQIIIDTNDIKYFTIQLLDYYIYVIVGNPIFLDKIKNIKNIFVVSENLVDNYNHDVFDKKTKILKKEDFSPLQYLFDTLIKYLDLSKKFSFINNKEKILINSSVMEIFCVFINVPNFNILYKFDDRYIDYTMENFLRINEIVEKYNGFPLKSINNSILCYFEKNNIFNMMTCMNNIQKYFKENMQNFNISIAITYDVTYIGNIGSIKSDYTLIGDNVNTCARLLNISDENGIYFSEKAYKILINNSFFNEYKFINKGIYKLKGKEMPIEIYKYMQ